MKMLKNVKVFEINENKFDKFMKVVIGMSMKREKKLFIIVM